MNAPGGTLVGRGAGIVIQPELLEIMRALGLDVEENFGVFVKQRALLDSSGADVAMMEFRRS